MGSVLYPVTVLRSIKGKGHQSVTRLLMKRSNEDVKVFTPVYYIQEKHRQRKRMVCTI